MLLLLQTGAGSISCSMHFITLLCALLDTSIVPWQRYCRVNDVPPSCFRPSLNMCYATASPCIIQRLIRYDLTSQVNSQWFDSYMTWQVMIEFFTSIFGVMGGYWIWLDSRRQDCFLTQQLTIHAHARYKKIIPLITRANGIFIYCNTVHTRMYRATT